LQADVLIILTLQQLYSSWPALYSGGNVLICSALL